MKRIALVLLVLVFVCSPVFAAESHTNGIKELSDRLTVLAQTPNLPSDAEVTVQASGEVDFSLTFFRLDSNGIQVYYHRFYVTARTVVSEFFPVKAGERVFLRGESTTAGLGQGSLTVR